MIRRRMAKFASLMLASIGVFVHAAPIVLSSSTHAVAQQSGAGVAQTNCTVASIAELQDAVMATVAQLRLQAMSDEEIATAVGAELRSAVGSCSAARQLALVRNVVLILRQAGLAINAAEVQTAVVLGYGPISDDNRLRVALLDNFSGVPTPVY